MSPLLEQDYSQEYSYTNECVEGQDILRALLNSLPLSHLFFTMPARPRDLHNRLLPLSGVFFWVVLVCCLGASFSLLECNLYSNSFLTRSR